MERERPALAALPAEDDGLLVRVAALEQVLGEVQAGVREPAGAGEAIAVDEDALPPGLGAHAQALPHLDPEGLRLGGGPGAQGLVVREVQAPGLCDGLAELADPCPVDTGRAGRPEWFHGYFLLVSS
jgi:hypothetical protein